MLPALRGDFKEQFLSSLSLRLLERPNSRDGPPKKVDPWNPGQRRVRNTQKSPLVVVVRRPPSPEICKL